MMRFRLLLILPLMFVTIGVSVQAQSPELIVEIDRSQVYEGESFVYRLTLNHVESPQEPQFAGFDDFEVTPVGQQSLDSRQVSIINGRRSEVIRRGRQYTYRLVPRTSGALTIPAPTAEVDGETLTGRSIEVQVIPPAVQDTVLLEQHVDRSSVYPMQPVLVTLVIAVKELPGQVRERDPLTVQPQLPALSVPWLDDQQVPRGLRPQRSWKQVLEPLISRRGHGVQVNDIGSRSAISLFENRATGFHPTPRHTRRTADDGTESGYWEYEFRRTFVPQRVGTWSLGTVSLKGTFADGVEGERLSGSDIFAVAKDVSVTVKEVPTDGRPDSWTGAVGTFSVAADLVPSAVRVGDPMTFTLSLSGEGTLADTRPLQIAEMPGVAGNFRTYEATEESDGRTRLFTYSLRPLHASITEFPSLPVSYFDVDQEQYVTLQTEPIPVTVSEAETLSESEIVAAGSTGDSRSTGALERNAGGVFANVSGLDALRNDGIRPARWFVAWGVLVFACTTLSIGIERFRQRSGNSAVVRRRQAPRAAATALDTAESQLGSGDVPAACDSIRRAIAGVTASWAGITADGLTARDVADQLSRLGIQLPLVQQAEQLLQQCDAARYGGSGIDTSQLIEQARQRVDELVRALRRTGGAVS